VAPFIIPYMIMVYITTYYKGFTTHVASGKDETHVIKTKGQREPCPHATGSIQGYKLPRYLVT
jgi:hypothetical protein